MTEVYRNVHDEAKENAPAAFPSLGIEEAGREPCLSTSLRADMGRRLDRGREDPS